MACKTLKKAPKKAQKASCSEVPTLAGFHPISEHLSVSEISIPEKPEKVTLPDPLRIGASQK